MNQPPKPNTSSDANKPILENQSFKDEVKNLAFLSTVSDFASDLTNDAKKQNSDQKTCKNERASLESETDCLHKLSTAELNRAGFKISNNL